MPVNIERIIEPIDRALSRLERDELSKLREYLNTSRLRLERQLRPLYMDALDEVADQSRLFREARARVLLNQVDAALRTLELSSPQSGVTALTRTLVSLGYTSGFEAASELLSAFGERLSFNATVPIDRVSAIVENSAARLSRHSADAIAKIQREVVDGLIQGRGVRKVASAIKRETGSLYFEAVRIARHETGMAGADARRLAYERQGIDLVQRYATIDSRVCVYCGGRHGEISPRAQTVEKLHIMCRCYLAPVRPEWLEDDLIDKAFFERTRKEALAELASQGKNPRYTPAPLEREEFGRRPRVIWRP